MLGKMASELSGKADICKVLNPRDFGAQQSAQYLLDGEVPHAILLSPRDEYCFTNLALVHVDGESATSKKRTVRRFPYWKHRLAHVTLETAGHLDRDVEIKFVMGSAASFDIDVAKADLSRLTALYKALVELSERQEENETHLADAKTALTTASEATGRGSGALAAGAGGAAAPSTGAALTDACNAAFAWLSTATDRFTRMDATPFFQKYLPRAYGLD